MDWAFRIPDFLADDQLAIAFENRGSRNAAFERHLVFSCQLRSVVLAVYMNNDKILVQSWRDFRVWKASSSTWQS
jgi:hypothetical protein